MKVIETGADRTAYAHIHVKGQVQPLQEYGQYIDSHDGAICCYVAVEEGHNVRVDGRFSGATLTVAYDLLVDGVCRKANAFTSKSVQVQKNKKLDIETILYQTADGLIDTDMSVSRRSGTARLNKDIPETIGTIELRVYITRQFGVDHEINEGCKYDKVEDTDTDTRLATYKDVPPQFYMTFETNCSTLDGAKATRERKKVYARRPGKEPWAIFRFHYRSKESILGNKMKLSFDAVDKAFAQKEPHALELEPVPMLLLGSKPAEKNDGDQSVRTSSPAPPSDTPSTSPKNSKKAQIAQPKFVVRRQQPKSTPTMNTPTASETVPIIETESATFIETLADIVPDASTFGDLQSTCAQAAEDLGTTATAKNTAIDKPNSSILAAKKDVDATVAPKRATKKTTNRASVSTEVPDAEAESKEIVRKTIAKADDKDDAEIADMVPLIPHMEDANVPTIATPTDMSIPDTSSTPSTLATELITTPISKDVVKNGAQRFVSPFKKAAAKPAPVDPHASTSLQKSIVLPIPTTPIKRAPEGILTPPPDSKRMKTDSMTSLTSNHILPPLSASPSPRPMSIEAQVAEHRKRLEAARQRRTEMAAQKAAIDKKMVPYKQRIIEELERLRQEVANEEMMIAEDEEDCNTSKALLEEYMRADSGGF